MHGFLKTGFGAGLLAGLVAGLGMLGLRSFLDVQSLQELIVERLLIVMGAEVFNLLLQQVWTLGKTLAVIGTTLGLAVAGGIFGVIYERQSRRIPTAKAWPALAGLVLGLALWLVANVALLPLLDAGFFGRAASGSATSLQVILAGGCLLYGLTLVWALSGTVIPAGDSFARHPDEGRRQFLLRSAGLLGLGVVAASGARFLLTTGSHAVTLLAKLREDTGELPEQITPVAKFYSVTKNLTDPDVSASSWRLSLAGQMDRPFSLTLDELRALPSFEQIVTLQCIENPVGGKLISNGQWRGVHLADLLTRAGLQSGVGRIIFRSVDGYEESLSLADALRPEVMVAYDMNGGPLAREHGFPARMIIPGRYGMKMSKWLEGIGTTRETAFMGYWQLRGWDQDAFVKTTSQIIVPRTLDPVLIGKPNLTGGIAFAGDKGISRVEFSSDGTTWHAGTLTPAVSPFSWVLWSAEWTPTDPTIRHIVVRAYDASGARQVEAETDAAPSGPTGLHNKLLLNVREADRPTS